MPLAYLVDGARFKLAVEGGIVKREAFKALEDARALLDECHALDQRLREESRQAVELERRRGFEQGYREGIVQCAQRLTEIEQQAAQYLGTLDDKLVRLVMQVVRRIAPRIGAQKLVPELVEEALKEVRAERFLVVRVHPDCRDDVHRRLQEIKQAYPLFEFVDVLADPELDRFACSLESEAGIVRADLDIQLEAIERALRRSIEASMPAEKQK